MSNHRTTIRSLVFGLFLLLIVSLGFMKPSLDVGFVWATPTDLIFPIVFLGWLIALATGAFSVRWRTEYLIFAFYFLAVLISAIFSVNPQLSFSRLPGAAYLILLAIVTASIVTSFNDLRIICAAWLAGSVIPLLAGLAGILLFYLAPGNAWLPDLTYHYGAVPVGNFPRISSTFISASMFCNYLTVTLMLVLASVKLRWIGVAPGALIIFAVGICALFTVSIAIGGIVLALGLWLSFTSARTYIAHVALTLSGAVAIAFLAISPFALSAPPGAFLFGGLTPSSRFLVWRDAIATFLADPLTGHGVGTAVANVAFQNYEGTWSLLTDAHNLFLSVAAQSGVPGLVGIIAIAAATLRASLRRSEKKVHNYIRGCLGIAFFTAFVYEGLTSSFEDARHLWVLIGLILAAERMDETGESSSLHGA